MLNLRLKPKTNYILRNNIYQLEKKLEHEAEEKHKLEDNLKAEKKAKEEKQVRIMAEIDDK